MTSTPTPPRPRLPPRRSAIPHPPVAGLLLLHGRHMRPAELEPFVPALGLPVHCLAPAGPVHHEDGRHSWWPVDMREREAELATGASELSGLYPAGRELARECLGRAVGELHAQLQPGQPLLLAGFSQGGMLALDYLLHTGDPRIGGLAIFSASRLAMDEWRPRLAALAGMPVLLAHGRQDANLSFAAGEALRELLVGAAAQVQWLPFDGGHEVALVVWRALRRFVASRVPA